MSPKLLYMNQWFSEAQFAAYTTLGRIMGNHAMECVKLSNAAD